MLTILNDVHAGVVRNAGTTPRSALALGDFVTDSFGTLVAQTSGDLCILGDLFDQYLVSNSRFLEVFTTLARYVESKRGTLHLVAGNHDLSKDSSRLSSFELLGELLKGEDNVRVHMAPGWVQTGVWVIPHCTNQDVFDLHLAKVPAGAKYVLLHANYNNFHAEKADHSLNVSEAQALSLVEAGATLVFAHEHQQRYALDKRVVVIGNQIPTSVADCLGPDHKYGMQIKDDGSWELFIVAKVPELFARLDWRDLKTPPLTGDIMFIRVEGEASANEAADVVTAISKYRARSDAFVITNAVKIDGVQALEELPDSLESAKSFDVLSAILETLDEHEQAVVKRLLQEGA